jgi:hypothetical protein
VLVLSDRLIFFDSLAGNVNQASIIPIGLSENPEFSFAHNEMTKGEINSGEVVALPLQWIDEPAGAFLRRTLI